MDVDERKQVRLILEHLSEAADAAYRDQVEALYAAHAATGKLRSGNTIHAVIDTMNAIASQLVKDCVDQVSAVAMDSEAYSLISETLELYLSALDRSIESVVTMAGGASRRESVTTGTNKLFADLCKRLRRQLQIHQFTFTRPAPSTRNSNGLLRQPAPSKQAAKGGRPAAEFWDDMWSAIAVQLYDGTLQPKNQADIERAMSGWISAHGHDAAPSTVRGRARRLWDAMAASKD